MTSTHIIRETPPLVFKWGKTRGFLYFLAKSAKIRDFLQGIPKTHLKFFRLRRADLTKPYASFLGPQNPRIPYASSDQFIDGFTAVSPRFSFSPSLFLLPLPPPPFSVLLPLFPASSSPPPPLLLLPSSPPIWPPAGSSSPPP